MYFIAPVTAAYEHAGDDPQNAKLERIQRRTRRARQSHGLDQRRSHRELIKNWEYDGPTQQGAQYDYTDLAIKTYLLRSNSPTAGAPAGTRLCHVGFRVDGAGLGGAGLHSALESASRRGGGLVRQRRWGGQPLGHGFHGPESAWSGRVEVAHARKTKAAHLAQAASGRRR